MGAMLRNAAEGKPLITGLRGRSEHGGAAWTQMALVRGGLLDRDGRITASGRLAIESGHVQAPFQVSANYIDWAHEPGAESGQALAMELCELAASANHKGQAEIPANRLDLVLEIIDVASLYVGGDDTNLQAARVLKRAQRYLNGFPKEMVDAARVIWKAELEKQVLPERDAG